MISEDQLKKITFEEAVRKLDVDKVRELLDQGVDPKFFRPLWCITEDKSKVEILKLIVKYGGDLNYDLARYIFEMKQYAKDLVTYVLENVPNTKEICQMLFCELLSEYRGSLEEEIFQLLIDRGLPVNDFMLTQSGVRSTPLIVSVKQSKINFVSRLLELGADVEKVCNGRTALHVASGEDKPKIVQMLLDRGANVNALNYNNETALHLASREKNLEIVRLLLNHRADLNILDYFRRTALHVASFFGTPEIVRILIERGSNLNLPDFHGRTALHLASYNCEPKILRMLLITGADINVLDIKGNTPLTIAGQEKLEVTFIKEVVKLQFKYQPVRLENLEYWGNDERTKKIFDECLVELNQMKHYRVYYHNYDNISIYSVLDMKLEKLIMLTKNEDFFSTFESLKPLIRRSFGYYGSDLCDAFEAAEERKDLLQMEEKKLLEVFKDFLPELVINKILYFTIEYLFFE